MRRGTRNEGGFTLLETLVSIGIAAVVLGGLATAVRSQSRSAMFQMGTADLSQNVRSAISLFKRDVRMAGYGMGAVPSTTLEPLIVEAVGAGETYRVRLRGDYSVLQCGAGAARALCTATAAAGSTSITIDATGAPYPTFTVGSRVTIESRILGIAEVKTITGWNGATRVLTVSSALTQAYGAGSPVHQVDDILYVLDNQGVLWRNGSPVADQITAVGALQVQYVLGDGTVVANPSAALDKLRGATIRLRSIGADHDGLQPQADMSTEVRIRNLGISTVPEEDL